jgi:hypothetical protein
MVARGSCIQRFFEGLIGHRAFKLKICRLNKVRSYSRVISGHLGADRTEVGGATIITLFERVIILGSPCWRCTLQQSVSVLCKVKFGH